MKGGNGSFNGARGMQKVWRTEWGICLCIIKHQPTNFDNLRIINRLKFKIKLIHDKYN